MKTQTYYKATYTGKFGNTITDVFTLNYTNTKDIILFWKDQLRINYQSKYYGSYINTINKLNIELQDAFGFQLLIEKSKNKFVA